MFAKLESRTLRIVARANAVAVILIPLIAIPLDTVKNLVVSHIYWSYFAASDIELQTASSLVHVSNYVLIAIVLLVETVAIVSSFLAFRELRNRRKV